MFGKLKEECSPCFISYAELVGEALYDNPNPGREVILPYKSYRGLLRPTWVWVWRLPVKSGNYPFLSKNES